MVDKNFKNKTKCYKILEHASGNKLKNTEPLADTAVLQSKFPNEVGLQEASQLINNAIKSHVKSIAVNKTIMTLFNLDENKQSFAKDLLSIMSINYNYRIGSFYLENSKYHVMDMVLTKTESSRDILNDIRNRKKLRKNVFQLNFNSGLTLFKKTRKTYGEITQKSMIGYLIKRKKKQFPKLLFDEITEPLNDDIVEYIDGKAEYNMKLKFCKCEFLKSSLEYLGHSIHSSGVCPSRRNIKKIMEMREPTNGDELKSFLAICNFYRRTVNNMVQSTLPLTMLLKKSPKFVWGNIQQEAFDHLKKALSERPLLAYPGQTQVQILTTNGSNKGLGSILSQSPDGSSLGETVIGYASRTLPNGEVNYSATHVEAFAVVWSVNYWRQYLSGRRFILYGSFVSKIYIPKSKPCTQDRPLVCCNDAYDYETIYRKGGENPANRLSRLL